MSVSDELGEAFAPIADVIRMAAWEQIPEDDPNSDGTTACGHPTGIDEEMPLGVVNSTTYCEAPVARRRVCSRCNGFEYACAAHADDSDGNVNDLDLAWLQKQLLPMISTTGEQLGQIERQLGALARSRGKIIGDMGRQVRSVLDRLLRTKPIGDYVQVTDEAIVLGTRGTSMALPRELFGDDPVADICEIVVSALVGVGHGISGGIRHVGERRRPTILVRCDDEGEIGDEHKSILQNLLSTGSQAELVAINAALRTCARPATAYRATGHIASYVAADNHEHPGVGA